MIVQGHYIKCYLFLHGDSFNLSKIESRPLKTGLGHYFFIIDVLEDEKVPMMKGAIEELELWVAK